MRARASIEGSVALEGALALLPLALALVLHVELGLRARRHAVLSWATCRLVRTRGLGGSLPDAEARAKALLVGAFGSAEGARWSETRTEAGLSLRGQWLRPALWRQRMPTKTYFEVNELCRFPF